MLILRYKARVSDLATEYIDQYCETNPDFREIWRWMLWKLEFGMADDLLLDLGDGMFSMTIKHSPRFPIVTLYLRFPTPNTPTDAWDDGVPQVNILDVTFHSVH